METERVLIASPDGGPTAELQAQLASLGIDVTTDAGETSRVVLSGGDRASVHAACARLRGTELDGYVDVLLLTDDQDLAREVASDRDGPDDVRRVPKDANELAIALELARRRVDREAGVRAQQQELVDLSAQLFEQGRFDSLTGVGNRRAMDEQLAGLWSRARRHGQPFCAVLFDIDHFKRLNDHFGHEEGDRVLKRVADALSAGRPGDTVYRYGGEEFLLTVPETTAGAAVAAAERRRAAVQALAIPLADDDRTLTISAGVACVDPTLDESVEALLARADAALYRAKAGGRNRVVPA